MQSIGGYIRVSGHGQLTTLGDFTNLTSIGTGEAYVPSQGTTPNTSIVIEDNNRLTDCVALINFLPNRAHPVSGNIFINNNANDCNSQDDVLGNIPSRVYIGDITVSTQAQVDALMLTTIDTIDGDLTLGYTSGSEISYITDLTPFSNIVHITGDLNIQRNGILANLTDLTHLQSIGDDFRVENNDRLTTLGNFSDLQSIGEFFLVRNNDRLKTSLGDFPALQSIGRAFAIISNPELTTLGNFSNLQTIGEFFSVRDNNTLTSLGSFPALTSIGSGSTTVPSEGGTTDNVSIVVEGNSSLTDCLVLLDFLPDGAHPVSAQIFIGDNATGGNCNSNSGIIDNTTHVGNVIVTTQTQVNALLTTLAGKTIINGRLTIGYTSGNSQSNITDLTPLRNITRVANTLAIQKNGQLVNLNDLTHLRSIGQDFNVSENALLTTLGNLSDLQSIGEYLIVNNNPRLTTLGTFPALQSIKNIFEVSNNPQLTTLGNFPVLQSIGDFFNVRSNTTLTTLGIFPELTSIGSGQAFVPSQNREIPGTSIVIENNDSLSNCSGLIDFLTGGLHAVTGDIYIGMNNATHTRSCNSESEVLNTVYPISVTVSTQAEVNALSTTLTNIDTIDGNLTIGYTDNGSTRSDITDLTPLSNLVHITGNLIIQQNGVLVNLNGLDRLQTVGSGFLGA